jgi:hypothetical protein
MRFLRLILLGRTFEELDVSIGKLKKIRDSYRCMNIQLYGEELAKLLNEW